MAWPPRSPDPKHIVWIIWGFVKGSTCVPQLYTPEDLKTCFTLSCPKTDNMFPQVYQECWHSRATSGVQLSYHHHPSRFRPW